MIRSIRPTDLVAFARFNARALPNEARTVESVLAGGGRRLGARPFVGEWLSLDEMRHSWISLRQGTVTGFVSTRSRSPTVWEVDRLRFIPGADSRRDCTELLDYVAAVAAENQVLRVLLRLDETSDLVPATRRAGFRQFASETVCALPGGPHAVAAAPGLQVRLRRVLDDQPLFRFYSAAVPADVRQVIGMTIAEWEGVYPALGRSRRVRETVAERSNEIVGWARAVRSRVITVVEITTEPGDVETPLALLADVLAWTRRDHYVLIPVAAYQDRLASAIGDLGGRPVAHFAASARQLAARVRMPALVPVRA